MRSGTYSNNQFRNPSPSKSRTNYPPSRDGQAARLKHPPGHAQTQQNTVAKLAPNAKPVGARGKTTDRSKATPTQSTQNQTYFNGQRLPDAPGPKPLSRGSTLNNAPRGVAGAKNVYQGGSTGKKQPPNPKNFTAPNLRQSDNTF